MDQGTLKSLMAALAPVTVMLSSCVRLPDPEGNRESAEAQRSDSQGEPTVFDAKVLDIGLCFRGQREPDMIVIHVRGVSLVTVLVVRVERGHAFSPGDRPRFITCAPVAVFCDGPDEALIGRTFKFKYWIKELRPGLRVPKLNVVRSGPLPWETGPAQP